MPFSPMDMAKRLEKIAFEQTESGWMESEDLSKVDPYCNDCGLDTVFVMEMPDGKVLCGPCKTKEESL